MEIRAAVNDKLITMEHAAFLAEKKARRLKIGAKVINAELCYKKIYFLKIIAYAARTPFKPKKIGYVVYYDSVADQGGITSNVPETTVITVADKNIFESTYTLEDFKDKKAGLIEKFVLKNYLLKRPDLEEVGVEEVYLPYWACEFSENERQEGVIINAATGKYNI